jgi:hypothetical protein
LPVERFPHPVKAPDDGVLSTPISPTVTATTSPSARLNGAGGTRQVPVARTTPSG